MANRAYARSNAGDDEFMDMLADAGQRGQVFLKNGRLCFAAPAAKVKQLSAKRKRAGEPPSELDVMCGYDDEDDFLGDQDISDDYSPGDDSEEEAPKKKKKAATASKAPAARKGKAAAGGGTVQPQQVPEKVAKAAATALRAVKTNISGQMQYKRSLKHATARCAMEAPCLPLEVVEAMLGPALLAKASNGRKQLKVEVDGAALREMFPGGGWGGPFSKSLRYGATLELIKGLTFTYNKEEQVLKSRAATP